MTELCCEYLFVWFIWLCAILMSHARFRVNFHSIVTWMSRSTLLNTVAISEVLTNDWAVLWVLICTIHLTVCYCYFRYTFQGESILYSYLNATKLPARNKFDIWNLSDSNRIWTHNLLVRKQTLNHLAKRAKWLSCVVRTYLYGAFDCMLFSCHALVSEWIYTL